MTLSDPDLDYLRQYLEAATFCPHEWEGEDRNLGSFRSKEELVAWWCQPPGVAGQPYRDRGFYSRELAMLSRLMKPRVVVEFGTSLGMGTCLLRWLNPEALLVTVDVNAVTFMPGDLRVPVGHLAGHQGIPCEYVLGNSWDFRADGNLGRSVDFCFIDADHSYEAVVKDSARAWLNRATDGHPWAVAWHDHNDRHPGVVRAVAEFCAFHGLQLQSRPDSDTVWVWGNMV